MTIRDLLSQMSFEVISEGNEKGKEEKITGVYCCDLLSIAMAHMKQGMAWVTVMANMNTLAVAELSDAACVILAEGARLDEVAVKKAKEEGIFVLATEDAVFETALAVHERL